MFGLIDYMLIALLFDAIGRRTDVFNRFVAWHRRDPIRPLTILLAVALAIAICFATVPVALRAWLQPDHVRAFATVQFIAGYHAMFFFGFALARSPDLERTMTAAWRVPAAIVDIAAFAYGA